MLNTFKYISLKIIMNEMHPFFSYEKDEWVPKFTNLFEELENPDIELSASLIFYDKKRPQQISNFLEKKMGLDGPFNFLRNSGVQENLTRSQKLKGISDNLKLGKDSK